MGSLRRLVGYVRPYLGMLLAAFLLLFISGALMGAVVSTIKPLINDVLLHQTVEAQPGSDASSGPDILRRSGRAEEGQYGE